MRLISYEYLVLFNNFLFDSRHITEQKTWARWLNRSMNRSHNIRSLIWMQLSKRCWHADAIRGTTQQRLTWSVNGRPEKELQSEMGWSLDDDRSDRWSLIGENQHEVVQSRRQLLIIYIHTYVCSYCWLLDMDIDMGIT